MHQDDFLLPPTPYLLNHSIGRPLKQAEESFRDAFFSPWATAQPDVWGRWLNTIGQFRQALGQLFNSDPDCFCPQTNVSSGITKLIMSLERLQQKRPVILMSEIDFPSAGFALQQGLPSGREIRFIPHTQDITDLNVWSDHLTPDVDLVFISHAYSNSGQRAPVEEIIALAAERHSLTMIDVAQAAGIIPLDLSQNPPDFLVGSSVKWLCGGPGAAYLWVNPHQIEQCLPLDVGWFSHEAPFEFNIRDFRYHPTALRFWGGTPSVAPFAIAAASIRYFAQLTPAVLRQHNQRLIERVAAELAREFISPRSEKQRNGTMILNFGAQQQEMLVALQQAGIQVDHRNLGMRVSPHIYNSDDDITLLLATIKKQYKRA